MSSAEALFARVIMEIRALINCDIVYLDLVCFETALAHPLLQRLCAREDLQRTYGKPGNWDEEMEGALRALYDITTQMGVPWISNAARLPGQASVGSLAVVPVSSSGGLLGMLVCCHTQPEFFHPGIMHLLQHYLATGSRRLLEGLIELYGESCVRRHQDTSAQFLQEQHHFLALLCHELRRPLTALKGYTELYMTYGDDPGAQEASLESLDWRAYLRMVQEKTQQLELLLNDVQDVARVSQGQLRVSLDAVDIVSLCRQMIMSEQERLDQVSPGQYRLSLEVAEVAEVAREMPPAWVDLERVRQALANLLDNAIKYSPQGGLIEILVTDHAPYSGSSYFLVATHTERERPAEDHYLYVTVHDHGVGIPRHLQQALFRPFTRLEHDMHERVPGNGLGLYLVQSLVEQMHGQVWLQSDEGRGTSITLALPIAPMPMADEKTPQPEYRQPQRAKVPAPDEIVLHMP
ncbi:hypothetical protein KSC_048470 [Ktedonobacter sp. SOSP1-52]|uniref:GAF domain-containing sensor histidine kinase n=1 Tax=Ktedonobacter sp. SOSP1-52 TaxID=2778366 RepID=UPI0019156B99|nr:GAF domain-containing sensor histidine kinase [Ktedonobacter sp. SOSP1-52]GHO65955.1 hypothetical protein KSC_048470 [Ktedonobacter sp. SOSP1-52]